jgi:hypothetical protein
MGIMGSMEMMGPAPLMIPILPIPPITHRLSAEVLGNIEALL